MLNNNYPALLIVNTSKTTAPVGTCNGTFTHLLILYSALNSEFQGPVQMKMHLCHKCTPLWIELKYQFYWRTYNFIYVTGPLI